MFIVDEESLGPRLSAVSCHENAPLIIWPEGMTECADINNVRVVRIDNDRGDVFTFFEPHVLPRRSAIGGLVHTIAERDAVSHVRLAGTDPDHIWIPRRECNVPD